MDNYTWQKFEYIYFSLFLLIFFSIFSVFFIFSNKHEVKKVFFFFVKLYLFGDIVNIFKIYIYTIITCYSKVPNYVIINYLNSF